MYLFSYKYNYIYDRIIETYNAYTLRKLKIFTQTLN